MNVTKVEKFPSLDNIALVMGGSEGSMYVIDKETMLKDSLSNNVFSVSADLDNAFIFTLSDLHIGMGNLNYIKEIVKFIKKLDNAYVIIGGDLLDNPTRNSLGNVLENYMTPQEQITEAVKLLEPIKSKIVAIIEGNHEKRTEKDCYISITQMIATMLGIPETYKRELAIGYFTFNKNCYVYVDLHKHRKTKNYYNFYNADILVLEHTHEYNYTETPIIFHNRYTKQPTVRTTYTINNGSALAFPHYAKFAGYSMQSIGTYVVEVSGTKRNIKVWKDVDLIEATERGYK